MKPDRVKVIVLVSWKSSTDGSSWHAKISSHYGVGVMVSVFEKLSRDGVNFPDAEMMPLRHGSVGSTALDPRGYEIVEAAIEQSRDRARSQWLSMHGAL